VTICGRHVALVDDGVPRLLDQGQNVGAAVGGRTVDWAANVHFVLDFVKAAHCRADHAANIQQHTLTIRDAILTCARKPT